MKVQEDETGTLDLPATHIDCIEGCGTFSLEQYGYGSKDNPVTSIDDIRCPQEEEGEDHPITLQHVSDEPKASPDAKKNEAVLAGNPWEGLSEFDQNQYHHGQEKFTYDLEEA